MAKKTIQELSEALELTGDDATVRGVVRYLEQCGVLRAAGVRPTATGRGRGATEYELAPEVDKGLTVAVERLAKALEGMRERPAAEVSTGSVVSRASEPGMCGDVLSVGRK